MSLLIHIQYSKFCCLFLKSAVQVFFSVLISELLCVLTSAIFKYFFCQNLMSQE